MRHQIEFDIPKSELRRIIDEWIYNPLHAEVLKHRYLDHMTFEAIAEKCNISTTSAKQIVYKHEGIIKEKVKAKNDES